MANLVNLQNFDMELRKLNEIQQMLERQLQYLIQEGRGLRDEVNLAKEPTLEMNIIVARQMDSVNQLFGEVLKGLKATYGALAQLAHNNRDGRG